MTNNKRCQAAMEFMLTYGWAIIVVIVAIGAVAYFGVLSYSKNLPEKCFGPAGLDCLDRASITAAGAGAGSVEFIIKNNYGVPIDITGVSLDSPDCTASSADVTREDESPVNVPPGTVNALNGDKIRIEITCDSVSQPVEGKFVGEVDVSYINSDSGFEHTVFVSIAGKAN